MLARRAHAAIGVVGFFIEFSEDEPPSRLWNTISRSVPDAVSAQGQDLVCSWFGMSRAIKSPRMHEIAPVCL